MTGSRLLATAACTAALTAGVLLIPDRRTWTPTEPPATRSSIPLDSVGYLRSPDGSWLPVAWADGQLVTCTEARRGPKRPPRPQTRGWWAIEWTAQGARPTGTYLRDPECRLGARP